MQKYTNKILLTVICLIVLGILSIPVITWLSGGAVFGVKTNNNTQTNTGALNYKGYTAIEISGAWQVQVVRGNYAIEMDNGQNAVSVELEGEVLKLGRTDFSNNPGTGKITVHLPVLTRISISGASSVTASNFAGHDLASLKLDLSGASKLVVGNSSYKEVHISMSGSSSVKFNDSKLQNVDLDTSGMSKLELNSFTNGKLSGNVAGVTEIKYSGTLIKNTVESSGVVNVYNIR
ncbi:MAG: hypothetical protein K0R14_1209 [Burkholderiales bacterium]|jgi:hypothetical protein|nr:hypothetical protein [Burkholderiales bacterium]